MPPAPDILCIGSVLWDVIGRAERDLSLGEDVPGRITRLPGGVAMNIAMALKRFGMAPALLTAIGDDPEGAELIARCEALGLDTAHVHRAPQLPTDRYIAVEGRNGLIAAIADAHTLEAAGAKILSALTQGPLGSHRAPYPGRIALDGNLTGGLLSEIAESAAFAAADLRVASASAGKVVRLRPFLKHPRATLYVNREEAGFLCDARFADAAAAADMLCARGAARVLVTDRDRPAAEAGPNGSFEAAPPIVRVTRVTGAGDTFMAAHIAAEARGERPRRALDTALHAAADHVAGPHS
ncbi:MAG: PfkB family carbohydrate kinase [Rhodobacter sp.]|nr:PfkB family carbohydrate kinase [Rhodobacter sp.]